MKKFLIVILCFIITVSTANVCFASSESTELNAEIMNAKGGADAIISMTFDDGIYDTAVFLNKMFKIYNLRGSCMMLSDRIDSSMLEKWQSMFAEGQLEAQNHSATHMVLPADSWAAANNLATLENNTQENYQKELVDSKATLSSFFDNNIIGFAPSNNTLSDGAWNVAADNYYAIRLGSRGLQSINPSDGTDAGGWHNLKMRGFNDAKATSTKTKAEVLCGFVDEAVENGGWLVTMCHGISKNSGDAKEAEAELMFRHISELQNQGKIWSASFGDAIKYIRERQVSSVREYENSDGLFVELTRDMTTSDGKYLDEKIFDYPLTVKAAVPSGWEAVSYTQNGQTYSVNTFTENSNTYAYLDLVPNAGVSKLVQRSKIEDEIKAQADVVYFNNEIFEDFDPKKTSYNISVEPNSKLPEITAVSLSEGSEISVRTIAFPGRSVVSVTNGGKSIDYSFNFYVKEGIYDFNAPAGGSQLDTVTTDYYMYNLTGQDWVHIKDSNTSSVFMGQTIITREKTHAGSGTLKQAWFGGDYSEENPYYSFKCSLGCTVYYVNMENVEWVKRPSDWTDSPSGIKFMGKSGSKLPYKHFEANEEINLPNFGTTDSWTDESVRYEANPGCFVIVLDEYEEAAKSEEVVIENNVINGYGNMSVGELKSSLILANGYSAEVYDENAAFLLGDSDAAKQGMIVRVSNGETSKDYILDIAEFEIEDVKTHCTNTSLKNAFKNGTLTAGAEFKNYKDNLNMMLLICQYDKQGRLIKFASSKESFGKVSSQLSASLVIDDTEDTIVKVMLVDSSDNVMPYKDAVLLTPVVK